MSDSIKERKRAAPVYKTWREGRKHISPCLPSRALNPPNGKWRRGKPIEKDSFESDGKADGVRRLI